MSDQAQTRVTQARAFLRSELSARHEKNPQYSLRAFARSLGVSHTLLSLVLAGKRPMSRKMAGRISDRLGMDPVASAAFVERGDPHAKAARTLASPEKEVSTRMSLDQFALISEWYHYAILSLLEVPGAKFEAKWIAARLGIGEMQASLAIDRLQRLGLVVKQGRRWRQSGHPIRFDDRTSTSATRKFHKQLLDKAKESIDSENAGDVDFSSMTFALDPAALPLAKERIRDFRRALVNELEEFEELEGSGGSHRVYHLSIQLFPLSKKPNLNALNPNQENRK